MHGGFDELLNTSMRRVRAELRIIVYPRCHALRPFITSSSGYLARYISTARFIRGELRTVGISSIPVLFFALSLHAKASVGSSNIAHGVGSIIFAYKSHHMTVLLQLVWFWELCTCNSKQFLAVANYLRPVAARHAYYCSILY